jgi:acetyl esterase/lipase
VPPGAEAWLVLHTTTVDGGDPAVASATILASRDRPDGPRPVLAWAHGTTGIVPGCAPSLLDTPWGGIPALDAALDAGWIVVATDYVGLGTEGPHRYLVGDAAARNVLDSVRAARALDAVPLAEEVVVWGHSQGGHAALFTGQEAASYAPDVDLVGVAAISPPTDLAALLAGSAETEVGKVLSSLALVSWSRAYDDLAFDDVVRPGARGLVRDIAGRCVVAPEALLSGVQARLLRRSVLADGAEDDPVLTRLLGDNTPSDPIDVPVLVAQGLSDSVVDPDVTDAYVQDRCGDGQVIEYLREAGQEHMTIVGADSPVADTLVEWTEARFAGDEAATECTTVDG